MTDFFYYISGITEDFNPIGAVAGVAGDALTGGLRNIPTGALDDIVTDIDVGRVTKNVDVGGVTKKIDLGGVTKNIVVDATILGDDAVVAVTKGGDDVAALRKTDELAGVAGDRARGGDDVAGVAGDGARGGDDVAGVAGDGARGGDDVAGNTTYLAKAQEILTNKKVIGGVVATGAAAALLAYALDSFNKNNNKKVGITKSYAGTSNGDIVIEFNPEADIVDGDKVQINGTDFIPTLDGQTISVKTIKSKSSIVINTSTVITTYATKGTLTIKTTMENRLADKSYDATKTVTQTGGSVVKGILGPALGGLADGLGLSAYKDYIMYFCIIICCLIVLSIIYKVYTMFKG